MKELDFSTSGAYSIYNWELFFHAPLLIAIHLSQNQQFQDAQNWFHTIFDPTDDSDGPTPAEVLESPAFPIHRRSADPGTPGESVDGREPATATRYYQLHPSLDSSALPAFCRRPIQANQLSALKTVMAYLDNLIAWGDSLFRQYTIETINEATQIYVLAANILQTKPQVVPVKESSAALTYAGIRPKLNAFSDALVDMEVDIPFDVAPDPAPAADPTGPNSIASIGQALFFCVPQNDTLLGYWDTVADRLFKSAIASISKASFRSCLCSTRPSIRPSWCEPLRRGWM